MADTDQDPYELLSLTPEASLDQIRRAYRTTSLKVHPDKNPSPQAASLFHTLTQAYNLLLDPQKRQELDAGLAAKRARREQLEKATGKKRAMLEELEKAERAAKRSKQDSALSEQQRKHKEDEVKAAGKRMREEAARRLMEVVEQRQRAREEAEREEVSPLELTLLLRLPHPAPTALQLAATLGHLGPLDPASVIIRPPKPPKAGKEGGKKKGGTAVVQFLTKAGALKASQAGGRKDLGLEGVKVEWAGGEPEWVKRVLEEPVKPVQPGIGTLFDSREFASMGAISTFDFGAPGAALGEGVGGLDYESVTLARMRKMERERLEREILKQEEGEAN